MSITTKFGDILEHSEDFLIHQCNCVTFNCLGLAKSIFTKYPDSNTYQYRVPSNSKTHNKPGTIDIFVSYKIMNLYCQYQPGKPSSNDTSEMRIKWLYECFEEILNYNNKINHSIKSIAVPFNFGCGLAGGDWERYYEIFKNFANDSQIDIVIYKLDNKK